MDKKLQLVFCVCLFWTNSFFAQPALVKDINVGAGNSGTTFEINASLAIGDTYYFAADDGTTGMELWKSDGSANGTELVKDIYPGATTSDLQDFADLSGILIFYADDGTNGMEIWRSDGTEAGTYMIKDINPTGDAIFAAIFAEILVIGDIAFFRAFQSSSGTELWKTDGTEAGTVMVKDIYALNSSSSPRQFVNMNGILYFTASTGVPNSGVELFRSDGTESGTYLVKDIYPGAQDSQIKNITVAENILFFTATNGTNGEELWKSDGTEAGTVMVKDINPGALGSVENDYELFAYNDLLLFVAKDNINEADLWISDGTEAGTQMLKEFNGLFNFPPENFELYNGLVYFFAYDDTGNGLWKTDGTTNGTVLVKEFLSDISSVERNIVNLGDQFVLVTKDIPSGFELWVSDGTEAGTTLTGDIRPGFIGSDPANVMNVNGAAFFTANDGIHGRELWKYEPGVVPLSISLSQESEILCNGDNTGELLVTVIGGEAPYTYSWTPSALSGNNPANLEAGVYTVTVSDEQGSAVSESITITEPDTLEINTSSTVETDGNMDGTATAIINGGTSGYAYEWSTNPIQTTNTATNLSAGEYFVTITDNNGCSIVGSVIVGLFTNVNDLAFGEKLQIYPTITEGVVNVNFDISINELHWELIDANGKSIYHGTFYTNGQLDFRELPSGMYFIRFYNNNSSFYTQRILIE